MEELIPANLNLFSTVPVLLSVSESKYEKIGTKTALDGATPILEFTANADKVYYSNLSSSYLMIKCKFTKADGSVINPQPTIGPIQYPVTSIFKSIDMWINDIKCTPTEQNLAYIHFLYAFSQSEQAKKTYLSLGLWYEDTYESIETANQSNPQAAEDANPNLGLKRRADIFGSSKEVTLIGRFCIAPHMCERLFLPNCKFDYKMQLNDFAFFTMTTGVPATYKFVITDAAILLQRVAVSPSVSLAHAQLLQSQNAVYPCKYMVTRTYNIPIGSYSFKFENCFVGHEIPVNVFLVFVRSVAKNGSVEENPFVFHHLSLTELICRMGARKIPSVEYKLNPAQNQTQMALLDTFLTLDCYGANVGPGNFDRHTFENGLFILGFDLSRDASPEALYRNATFEATNLSFEGTFTVATAAAYTVIVFGQLHGQIEFNKFMTPFTSWG